MNIEGWGFSGIMPRSQRGCQGFNSLPVHSLENIIHKLGNHIT